MEYILPSRRLPKSTTDRSGRRKVTTEEPGNRNPPIKELGLEISGEETESIFTNAETFSVS